jgi:hypothetical protein
MSSLLKPFLAVCALLIQFAPHVGAVDLYVLSSNNTQLNAGSSSFGKIDSATGVYTHIASFATSDVANITWNNNDSVFYVTNTVGGVNGSIELRTLTTTGTLSSAIGTVYSGTNAGNAIYGMAFDSSNSNLYAYSRIEFRSGTIGTGTGVFTGNTVGGGLSVTTPIGGRYALLNGTLYTTGNNAGTGLFGTVGTSTTGAYTQTTTAPQFVYMSLAGDDANNTLYGVFGNGINLQRQLFTIDPATGALSAGPLITGASPGDLAQLGSFFHGVTVPEPSTYVLGSLATLVMGLMARRRRSL